MATLTRRARRKQKTRLSARATLRLAVHKRAKAQARRHALVKKKELLNQGSYAKIKSLAKRGALEGTMPRETRMAVKNFRQLYESAMEALPGNAPYFFASLEKILREEQRNVAKREEEAFKGVLKAVREKRPGKEERAELKEAGACREIADAVMADFLEFWAGEQAMHGMTAGVARTNAESSAGALFRSKIVNEVGSRVMRIFEEKSLSREERAKRLADAEKRIARDCLEDFEAKYLPTELESDSNAVAFLESFQEKMSGERKSAGRQLLNPASLASGLLQEDISLRARTLLGKQAPMLFRRRRVELKIRVAVLDALLTGIAEKLEMKQAKIARAGQAQKQPAGKQRR